CCGVDRWRQGANFGTFLNRCVVASHCFFAGEIGNIIPASQGPSKGDAMAKWLIAGLSWGGVALTVLSAAPLVATPRHTVALFWIMLFVGAVAAAVGIVGGAAQDLSRRAAGRPISTDGRTVDRQEP